MSNNFHSVIVNNVKKEYSVYNSVQDRFFKTILKQKKNVFKALDGVSFSIQKGQCIGFLGRNGAGKSTLLKVITGVLRATEGNVESNGVIASLLELGAGFNPEMTGVENIYLNGTLLGLSRKEIDAKKTEIIEFADIGDFINQPVKNYSSGMFARLAFSVAINVKPDILIIDEVLSVGDIRFQQKSLRKLKQFKEDGKTILFVSHDIGAVRSFCDRAIWIDAGKIKLDGDVEKVTKEYVSYMEYGEISQSNDTTCKINLLDINDDETEITSSQDNGLTDTLISVNDLNVDRFGSGEVLIEKFSLKDQDGNIVNSTRGGEKLTLALHLSAAERPIKNVITGFILKNKLGQHVLGTNSLCTEPASGSFDIATGERKVIYISFTMPYLQNGEYTISPALAIGDQDEHTQVDWVHDLCLITNHTGLNDQFNSYIFSSINFGTTIVVS
ncbi:ABC transporter ATP-binding protein [Vibrio splendidus]|uniref:ABC transporter domain-containing protein n=1 Tax=Vibrio splendidus TaxID=29497 RepID=A0A2N7JJ46_VIBSP|nr:ABC transporter ATP-binding protein [Vibrio splendidus]PMM40247.1 hypothetical protein BCT54_12760 [Vibrio splendidus]